MRYSVRVQFALMLMAAMVALVVFACVSTPPPREPEIELPPLQPPTEHYDIEPDPCAIGATLYGRCPWRI